MSGHSKWAQIKHKKGVTDKRKGLEFSKLANAISVAAREGSDPEMNFKLKMAIDKARVTNMPKENIKRAIARGSGAEGAKLEEITLEGYGPGGVAIMAKGVTDNKNRTLSEVRNIFSTHGGHLGGSGSVAYIFEPRGVLRFQIKPEAKDNLELSAIDAGAQEFGEEENELIVYSSQKDFDRIKKELTMKGFNPASAEILFEPKTTVGVDDETKAKTTLKLLDELENHDDIVGVYANLDIPEDLIEKVEGAKGGF